MLDRRTTGLIVIDLQGELARRVQRSAAVLARCALLIAGARRLGLPVLWVEQNPQGLGATVPELAEQLDGLRPIAKHSFGALGEPAFAEALEHAGCTSWLVCGIEAHVCVHQTAVQLASAGHDIHVVQDAVSSRSAADRQLALDSFARRGMALTSVEMCLFELLRDCRDPAFRDILALIK